MTKEKTSEKYGEKKEKPRKEYGNVECEELFVGTLRKIQKEVSS